jgi:hypothetical protein
MANANGVGGDRVAVPAARVDNRPVTRRTALAVMTGATIGGAAVLLTARPAAATGSNMTAVTLLGTLAHAGPPVAADGTFAVGDVVFDNTAQEWLCAVAGTPGIWLAVGSGKVLGSQRSTAIFTTSVAGATQDVPTMRVSFTYDGRPVRFVCTPVIVSQNQVTTKLVFLSICRATDSVVQANVTWQCPAAQPNFAQPMSIDSGPLTAWPSDAVPFVVGTTYDVKLRLGAGTGAKATIVGVSVPYQLYVITA